MGQLRWADRGGKEEKEGSVGLGQKGKEREEKEKKSFLYKGKQI